MISHDHKCIFIHIPRTGGTSIETAICGKDWWQIEPATKHIMWYEAKEIYSEYWNTYFKFTVVRNTWDWLVSLFFSHRNNRAKNKSWDEFVENPNLADNEQNSIFQSEIIGDDIDLVIKYDKLQEGFNSLCEILCINRKLPHVEGSCHKYYRSYYTKQQRNCVFRKFSKDIKKFNFRF